MKKEYISKRAFHLSLFFGLLCAVFLSVAQFNTACDDLRSNILRLHIIANSDSSEDQRLKLEIRDRILKESEVLFSEADDVIAAAEAAEGSLSSIEAIANSVIKEYNLDYSADAYVGDSYFETRHYEDFTLPAGTYKSLIVDLGKGEGKNWWCVIFPEVCLPAASDASLTDSVTEQSAKIASDSDRYIMRFKTVEIYEKLKKLIFE